MSLIRYKFKQDESPFRIEVYKTEAGRAPVNDWFLSLREARVRAIVQNRLLRVCLGNFEDRKPIGEGVWELRIDFGPGFRIYYAMSGDRIVLLLAAGDKSSQRQDIKNAISYWREFKRRENA
jgi:putative addiction module killer protein